MQRRSKSTEVRGSSDSWDVIDFGNITDNLDRARVPLNEEMRRQRNGEIPYYGTSGIIDYVDGATHEGTYVLISEDGRNLLTRNADIAFIASGRFWANNHVHVIKTHEEIIPEFLALQINSLDLENLVTGTAQPKLSQDTLNRIAIQVPSLDVQRDVLRVASELENTYNQLLDNQRLIAINLSAAWEEILEDAFRYAGRNVPALDLEEALEWLEGAAPILQSVIDERRATGQSTGSRGSSRQQSESSRAPAGWSTVREMFNIRYEKVNPDELEETVDDFYAWLKASLHSGDLELRRDGEETYLRTHPLDL